MYETTPQSNLQIIVSSLYKNIHIKFVINPVIKANAIADPEASVTYYCVYKTNNSHNPAISLKVCEQNEVAA